MDGYLRTTLLLAGLTAIFVLAGGALGGGTGAVVAFGMAAAMNFFAWWTSDRAVLRMQHARPVTAAEAPELHAMTAQLAARAGLPMPALYIVQEDQPNAFATGRNPANAAVAVTTGLLANLPPREVAGVVAHELAHIRNHDTLVMTIAATLAGGIAMLARFGGMFGRRQQNGRANPIGLLLAVIVAPIAAMLVQMAVSRGREFEADRVGAEIAGDPLGLAGALLRLEQGRGVPNQEATPETAHLFIVNPFASGLSGLFSTHPPTAARVAALEAQAGTAMVTSAGPWQAAARPKRNPWG